MFLNQHKWKPRDKDEVNGDDVNMLKQNWSSAVTPLSPMYALGALGVPLYALISYSLHPEDKIIIRSRAHLHICALGLNCMF